MSTRQFVGMLLVVAVAVFGGWYVAHSQMPELYLYTYLPIVRTHVQLGDGPHPEGTREPTPTEDAGPCCDNTIIITPTAASVADGVTELNVYMVYENKFGTEFPVGSGHVVYLYNLDLNEIGPADNTNFQSRVRFEDVPFGLYNIYGVYYDPNPFYQYDCALENVTLDQPVWTETLTCTPYWALRLPWSKGS